jgi:AcrR family transcriptional regulator
VERVNATRDVIMNTAERLFAEHGLFAVSNRTISEAAGQGNNAAVGYHFGTKADLIRAIIRRHAEPIDRLRVRAVARVDGSTEVRDWLDCLVRPVAEHLDSLGSPTWFSRFGAQLMTDPGFRDLMIQESLASPPLLHGIDGLNRCLPDLPAAVRIERNDMARQLIVHVFAERERALAEGTPTPRDTWDGAATGLIDALVGLWTAPVS